MGKILRIESYLLGKRKRKMVELLSNIEDHLLQFDNLADSLELIVLRGEGDGIGIEMIEDVFGREKIS